MPCTYEQFVSRVGSAWIDTDEKWAENTCNETLSRDKLFNLNIYIYIYIYITYSGMRLYGKTFLRHASFYDNCIASSINIKSACFPWMFFRSIISLQFFFWFLLIISLVWSPLIVLELFYYFVSYLRYKKISYHRFLSQVRDSCPKLTTFYFTIFFGCFLYNLKYVYFYVP